MFSFQIETETRTFVNEIVFKIILTIGNICLNKG